MLTKVIVPALCATAVHAAAGNQHRHLHNKKDIVYVATDLEVVTDYVTVTQYWDGDTTSSVPTTSSIPVPTTSSAATTSSAVSVSAEALVAVSTSSSTVPAPIPTTSSSIVELLATTSSTMAPPTPTTTSTPVLATPVLTTPVPTTMATSTTANAWDNAVSDVGNFFSTLVNVGATTTSSAVVAASTSASLSGSKRGLAYNDATLVSTVAALANGVFSWAYDWGSSSSGLDVSNIVYIPMLWCSTSDYTADWDANAKSAVSSGADSLLGFNEPDNAGQCNIDAATAAAGHIQYMNPYSGQVKIGAPAVTSSATDGEGVSYLSEWVSACGGSCDYDFCPGHWYGPGGVEGAQLMLEYAQQLYTACGNKPVWLTEFAATSGDTEGFMQEALDQLDNNSTYSFVERYSYFYLAAGSLMDSDTALSSLGELYMSTTD